MEKKKYDNEAKYIRVIHNWRRAVDQRGLSEETRQKYLQDVKESMNEDMIPWYSISGSMDYSTLEVNR